MILRLASYIDPHDPETPLAPAFVAVASYSLGGNPLVCAVTVGVYRSEAAARSGKARPIDVVQFRCGQELVPAKTGTPGRPATATLPAKVDDLGRVRVAGQPAQPAIEAVPSSPAVVFPLAEAIMAEARTAMVADATLTFDAALKGAIAGHMTLHPTFAGAETIDP